MENFGKESIVTTEKPLLPYTDEIPSSSTASLKGTSTDSASLDFVLNDKIELTGFPESIIEALRKTITTYWALGIQKEKDYGTEYEFKLRGFPWASATIESERLACGVFELLENAGYTADSTMTVNLLPSLLPWLLFKPVAPYPRLENRDFIAISFPSGGQMIVTSTHGQVDYNMVKEIAKIFGKDLDMAQQKPKNHSYQLKLTGWSLTEFFAKMSRFEVKRNLCAIIGIMATRDYTLYANLRESFYFRRARL